MSESKREREGEKGGRKERMHVYMRRKERERAGEEECEKEKSERARE